MGPGVRGGGAPGVAGPTWGRWEQVVQEGFPSLQAQRGGAPARLRQLPWCSEALAGSPLRTRAAPLRLKTTQSVWLHPSLTHTYSG